MYRKLVPGFVFSLIFAFAIISVQAQVAPQASSGGSPFTVGGGVSYFNTDWDNSSMIGIAAWVDYRLPLRPRLLDGLAVEVEGREIDWDTPSAVPGLRQEEGLGGAKYTFYHFHRAKLYGKFLAGFGGIYFPPQGTYSHDTRTVLVPGGGIEYPVGKGLEVRADYEYQFWRQLFGLHDLNPTGVTVGVNYTFGSRRE